MTLAVAPAKRDGDGMAKLVFNRFGTNYFLSQVWNPSGSIVWGLMKTAVTRVQNKQISSRVNPERIGGEAVGSATNSTL